MGTSDILGFTAATLTNISFVAQVIDIWRTRDTKAISLVMYILFCSGVFMWVVYGLALKSLPMAVSSLFTFTLALTVLALKIKYK